MTLRRELLPQPKAFYEVEIGTLSRADGRGWSLGDCPFHRSKSHKSFAVNLNFGGFHCFGCDAKGPDVIAFVRKRTGASFKDACRQLGCWDDSQSSAAENAALQRASLEVQAAKELSKEQERTKRLAARDYLHNLERHYREISEELSELGRQGINKEKSESCWRCLALLVDAIREAEHEYFRLCGLEQEAS
jgi:hypothetical protein